MKRWSAICRFGGIGDNLIAASVLRPLKRLGYMVEMITSKPNHVIYQNNPFIDKLSVKEPDSDLPKNDLAAWQEWFRSREGEYDILVNLSHSCEGRHAIFPTMTSFWWPPEYRRKLCAGSYLETVHDIVGVPHEFGPLFFSTEQEKFNAAEVKAKIGKEAVAWVINGSRIDKVYPYSAMAIGRIIREVGVPVVIIGGASDKEHSIANAIRDHVAIQNGNRDGLHLAMQDMHDVDKRMTLRTSLSFVNSFDLVVSPDTGLAWSVAMEPMPKVIMVSHASAENITKHWVNTTTLHADPDRVMCWPCHRLHESPATCVENAQKNGAACISDISVEKLVTAVAESWRRRDNVVHAENAFKRGERQ